VVYVVGRIAIVQWIHSEGVQEYEVNDMLLLRNVRDHEHNDSRYFTVDGLSEVFLDENGDLL